MHLCPPCRLSHTLTRTTSSSSASRADENVKRPAACQSGAPRVRLERVLKRAPAHSTTQSSRRMRNALELLTFRAPWTTTLRQPCGVGDDTSRVASGGIARGRAQGARRRVERCNFVWILVLGLQTRDKRASL